MNTHPEKPVIPSLIFPPTCLKFKSKLMSTFVMKKYSYKFYHILLKILFLIKYDKTYELI